MVKELDLRDILVQVLELIALKETFRCDCVSIVCVCVIVLV
jgi:hypothetical protein